MSKKVIVTLSDGSTEEHYVGHNARHHVQDGVLYIHKDYEGTTAYPLTSIIRWETAP